MLKAFGLSIKEVRNIPTVLCNLPVQTQILISTVTEEVVVVELKGVGYNIARPGTVQIFVQRSLIEDFLSKKGGDFPSPAGLWEFFNGALKPGFAHVEYHPIVNNQLHELEGRAAGFGVEMCRSTPSPGLSCCAAGTIILGIESQR